MPGFQERTCSDSQSCALVMGSKVQSSRRILVQSGFETSKCTKSGHLRFSSSMLKNPSNKPRKHQLLFCSPLPCTLWTLSSLMDSACRELLWQWPAFLFKPSVQAFSSSKPASGSQAWNWHLPFVFSAAVKLETDPPELSMSCDYKITPPCSFLPKGREIHTGMRMLSTEIFFFISNNWTMLGLRKWWYWKQADDIILWWFQSMKSLWANFMGDIKHSFKK